MRWALGALALFALSKPVAAAEAHGSRRVLDPVDTSRGDGVYGRFDGDLALRVGLRGNYDFQAERLRPGLRVAGVFYQTAGIYADYEQDVGGFDAPQTTTERAFALGLTISPLFLLRFQKDAEQGAATWELLLDSLALEGGVIFQDIAGEYHPGGEVGLSLGLPLLAKAPGPWLRASSVFRAGDFPATGLISLALEWQFFLDAGLFSSEH